MNATNGTTGKKIIVLEFNELCPPLLSRWMSEGALPNFKRFFDQSVSFTGRADVDDPEYLEPWIQWYSLHTGLSYEQHKVFYLTDGPAAGHMDVWGMLASDGNRVASFASMNNRRLDAHRFFVPDPWCNTESCFPAELQIYQDVVSSLVHENSVGGKGGLTALDALKFAKFYIGKGLNGSTIRKFADQAFREMRHGSEARWARVPLLDLLQFDLFRHYWISEQPNFCTFFLNSTAHFQHAYWHLAFPNDFDAAGGHGVGDPRSSAVLHGYQMMDKLLAGFFALEESFGAQLVLVTALSQQANPNAKMFYYRPYDIASILSRIGVSSESCLPVMAQQFSLKIMDVSTSEQVKVKLRKLIVEGIGPLFDVSTDDQGNVYFGSGIHKKVSDHADVVGFEDGQPRKFGELMHELGHGKTGAHHPDSVIWFKTGHHKEISNPVSILDMVPTFIDILGGNSMKYKNLYSLKGESLINQIMN